MYNIAAEEHPGGARSVPGPQPRSWIRTPSSGYIWVSNSCPSVAGQVHNFGRFLSQIIQISNLRRFRRISVRVRPILVDFGRCLPISGDVCPFSASSTAFGASSANFEFCGDFGQCRAKSSNFGVRWAGLGCFRQICLDLLACRANTHRGSKFASPCSG